MLALASIWGLRSCLWARRRPIAAAPGGTAAAAAGGAGPSSSPQQERQRQQAGSPSGESGGGPSSLLRPDRAPMESALARTHSAPASFLPSLLCRDCRHPLHQQRRHGAPCCQQDYPRANFPSLLLIPLALSRADSRADPPTCHLSVAGGGSAGNAEGRFFSQERAHPGVFAPHTSAGVHSFRPSTAVSHVRASAARPPASPLRPVVCWLSEDVAQQPLHNNFLQ